MRTAAILLLVTIVLLYSRSSFAQLAPLANDDFKEHYSSDVPVSGKALVGILIESKKINSRFYIKSTSNNTIFCFKVTSIDGTYASENEYILNPDLAIPNDQGLIELEYPTQFTSILKEFNDNELALLATEGACDIRPDIHFVATKDKVENDDKLRFLISSGRSQVFMRLKSKQHSLQPSCARIEIGKRTAYDTICEIELSQLSSAQYDADIVRRKGNRALSDVKFKLSVVNTE
jgi:hypothetical protein